VADVSDDYAVIGLWGPAVRGVLEDFPFRTAQEIDVGGVNALAKRMTYVGEYGYELYVAPDQAGEVWDFLVMASDTPFDSGLAFAVAKDKWLELDREPPTMLRTLLVGGEDYVTLYGGEAVHRSGEVIGRIRSAAYGFTVKRNVALAKLPSQLAEGDEVEVDVMGDLVAAVVAPQ
jgi:glycine cleavage system aminomethyltransferase T